ncbi:MAG: TRAP transporter small permease subunit, partial [Deltaproteobacteria bacterium]
STRMTASPCTTRSAARASSIFENVLHCLLLAIMLILSIVQITLRLQDSGLFWITPLLRLLVLWTGLMGAVAACRDKQHIAIDLFSRFVPGFYNRLLKSFLSLFSSGICFVLAWVSVRFVRDEATYGLRTLLSIPSWLQYSIFPLAFLLMGLHFLLHAGEAWKRSEEDTVRLAEGSSILQGR